jgi:hypothetical protein
MAKVRKRRRYSQRYTSAEFKPYVVALGQLALVWNDLQESLGALFWTLMNVPPQAGDFVNYLPLRVWGAIKSDRSQWDMLKAAVNYPRQEWRLTEKSMTELNWLLERAKSLSDVRNDAIHSPLFAVDKSLYGGQRKGSEKVAPAWWLFNPRAGKLAERKSLLAEFRYCRDAAIVLADYAQAIDAALVNKLALPDRPLLPNRPPKIDHLNQPRQPPQG